MTLSGVNKLLKLNLENTDLVAHKQRSLAEAISATKENEGGIVYLFAIDES